MLPQLEGKNETDLVSDILGLNDLEHEIYFSLLNHQMTVKELVEETGRTRSVVQRSLQDLLDKGLLVRKGVTDKTVYYIYSAAPFEEVREIAEEALDSWYENAKKMLEASTGE